MKKVLSMLLAIVMVFSMIPVAAFATDTDPTITFTTDFSTELERGDTFTVTATLANNPGIASFTHSLSWNQDVLTFVGFVKKPNGKAKTEVFASDYSVVANDESGVFTAAGDFDGTDDGMLYSAQFQIKETGSGNLGLGLIEMTPGTDFTIADKLGSDYSNVEHNFDAISGLMFGGPGMPENAPFTAITTDSEESPFVKAIVQQEDVYFNYGWVPYYVVYIPEDANTAYVTAPDQVVMEDYTSKELKATAYAADMTGAGTDTDPWNQLYINYDYEMVGEEVKVTVPLNMTYADWSGNAELCFVGDENGAATHAFGIEDAGNACLGLISFAYGAPPAAITIHDVEGCTIYALNEYDEEVTQAAPGEVIYLEYEAENDYEVTDIQVTCGGEKVELINQPPLCFIMPKGDVEITATCVAKKSEFAISKATDLANGTVKAMVSGAEVQTAAEGAEITLEVKADEGYRLAEGSLTVTKDGVTGEAAKVTVTNNKFTMPANAVTITASFVKETYPVNGTGKVAGGTVTAKVGDTPVPEAGCAWGETVTVEATPDEGYELTALTYTAGTGEPVGIKEDKSFVMPKESVTITATFTQTDTTTYSITAAAENGTVKAMVSGAEVQTAAEGTEITVEVIPAEGYQLEEGSLTVTKDGVTGEEAKVVVVDNKFTMPANPVTITASFIAGHTCTYDQEKVDDKYLKTEATCESAAVYYKSCTCGEFDNSEAAATFTSGSVVPHNYATEDGTCKWCGQPNPLGDIKIDLGNGEIPLNGTQLKVTSGENMILNLSFKNPADVKDLITWISSDDTVAHVTYNVSMNAFELIPGTAGTATISLYDNNDLVAATGAEESQTPTPLATFTVTVEEAPIQVEGYSITMDADKPSQMVGEENIPVSLKVNHHELTIYNSYKLELTYDPAVLLLTTATDESKNINVADDEGTVVITRYGSALTNGTDDIVLNFKAVAPGVAEVTLTKAYISDSDAALNQDAVAAKIIDNNEVVEAGTTVITVGGFDVDLSGDFSSEQTVLKPGEDLQFTSNIAPYYDYTVIVKVQNSKGEWTTLPAEALDGTGTADKPYTVDASYITGNISVESSEKIGKLYNVTIKNPTEDPNAMTGEKKAQYMSEDGYQAVFTPHNTEQYDYAVSVTVGGAPYTCTPEGGVYTIPGADIKGDIEFEVTVTPKQVAPHAVTITGSGAEDVVAGTAAATAAHGANYTFNLKMAQGYDYTVTATMGGNGVTPAKAETANDDGSFTYTIEKVTAALEIVIEKSNLVVEVSEYLDLNERTMCLITATKTLGEKESLSYNGNPMFYSEQYKAWAYLVIVNDGETLDAAGAKADITVGTTEFTTIPITMDVNMSNAKDINDAQLVYDMYAAKKYTDLAQPGIMEKLLRADTAQGDSAKKLDVNDARAVVDSILRLDQSGSTES